MWHFLCPQRHTASPPSPLVLKENELACHGKTRLLVKGTSLSERSTLKNLQGGPCHHQQTRTPQFLLGPLLWCVFCGLAPMYKAVSSPLWVMQSVCTALNPLVLCLPLPPSCWPRAIAQACTGCTARSLGMPAQHTAGRFFRVLLSLSDVPLSKSLVFPWHASSFSFSTNNTP